MIVLVTGCAFYSSSDFVASRTHYRGSTKRLQCLANIEPLSLLLTVKGVVVHFDAIFVEQVGTLELRLNRLVNSVKGTYQRRVNSLAELALPFFNYFIDVSQLFRLVFVNLKVLISFLLLAALVRHLDIIVNAIFFILDNFSSHPLFS